MRWYFAIDEAGSSGPTGEEAKAAVRSAHMAGGLEPRLMYYGRRNEFTSWMERHGVKVVDTQPAFVGIIKQAEAAGKYKAHSIGHWLRVGVPMVEQEQEFILYTDCDVLFLKQIDYRNITPKVFAAAPEFRRDNWNFFNAGVMVINVPAMRASYPEFEAHICQRIGGGNDFQYDDELALNQFYRGRWEKLDPLLNWKPYWGFDRRAALLHFHGPKLSHLETIVAQTGARPANQQLIRMTDAHTQSYVSWLQYLGERLQVSDIGLAARMLKTASGLSRRGIEMAGNVADVGFMDFRMFPEE